ncbi:hypothetical protein [Aquimarina agarilytica]|uniref:hypothetical protein n=1 Tax=Aquimarina agarilytica TaxID=1087449 RepID=UPI000287B3F5|nr:hypothetical protein [Aquimarina agarilytica]
MNKKVLIITGAGLAIGLAEALIYYNLGKNSNKEQFKFQVPKGKELLKTTGIVLATSVATAALSSIIEKSLESSENLTPQLVTA